MNYFGDKLKELRGSKTQAEFAAFLDINNAQTYGRYEKGRVPEAETLCLIANRCGCSVDWLLGLSENRCGYKIDSDGDTNNNELSVREANMGYRYGEKSTQVAKALKTGFLEKCLDLAIKDKDYESASVITTELSERREN